MAYKLLSAPAALIRAYQAAYVPPTTAEDETTCPDRQYIANVLEPGNFRLVEWGDHADV